MRDKTWRARLAAATLTLLCGAVSYAQDGGLAGAAGKMGLYDDKPTVRPEPPRPPRPILSSDNAKPTNTRLPRTADEFFQMIDGEAPAPAPASASETAQAKRYLVCFLQTKRFAYEDVIGPTGETIAKKGDVYDEPMRPCIEASYCAAGITLRSLGGFDEMLTVADQYLNKAQVKATFEALAQQTKPGDEIFIYWNGHGGSLLSDDNGDERDLADGANVASSEGQSADVDEMLSLYETHMYPNEGRLRATTLSDDELGDLFAKLKGRRVIAFFEACHAGGLGAGNENARYPAARPIFQTAPIPETVKTWAELKSQVDATGELLKMAGFDFAFKGWKTQIVARPVEENDGASPSASPNASPSASPNASPNGLGEALRALLDAADSKDLTKTTLDKLAVAFTSGFDQNSWARTRYIDSEGRMREAFVNPGAYAIYLAFRMACEKQKPLTFAEFAPILQEAIRGNCEYANAQERLENGVEEPQDATFLSNWDDATLYDPSWEFYVDERWFQGGEKWRDWEEARQTIEEVIP